MKAQGERSAGIGAHEKHHLALKIVRGEQPDLFLNSLSVYW